MYLMYLIFRNRESDKVRQRNMSQTKKQDKNEREVSNLPEKEFKVMVIKMFTGLERSVDKLREKI